MPPVYLHLHPKIHHQSKRVYVVNKKTRCELLLESSKLNDASQWESGKEFFLDTPLFRGKGALWTRKHGSSFPKDPQYANKHTIFRLVGHFKEPVDLNDLFIGGNFEHGVRGLPAEFIMKCGIQIAQRKSRHFCIRIHKDNPFVAVPFNCLVDELRVIPFYGRSARLWDEYNLQYPIQELWAPYLPKPILQQWGMNPETPHWFQKDQRHKMRSLPVSRWKSFPISPNQMCAFELLDSAFHFEDMVIQWKFANVIPLQVDLKHYIHDLPFSLFRVARKPCSHPSKIKGSAIPEEWQKLGLCDNCFPPRPEQNPEQFVFSLHASYKKMNH